MRYLTTYFSLHILIYLLHIFRYLDPIKNIIRYNNFFKISQDIFYDILRYSWLFKICTHIF